MMPGQRELAEGHNQQLAWVLAPEPFCGGAWAEVGRGFWARELRAFGLSAACTFLQRVQRGANLLS